MEKTLGQIKSISTKLFNERSYEGTSLKDIFKEIGISAPSFYYYYSSKKDLYLELLNDAKDEYLSHAAQFLSQNPQGDSSKEKLYAMLMALISFRYEDHQKAFFLYKNILFPVYEYKDQVEHIKREIKTYIETAIEQIVQEGIVKGDFREDISLDMMMVSIRNMVFGILGQGYNDKGKGICIDRTKVLLNMFFEGIAVQNCA